MLIREAIILAAGLGTRIGSPITGVPKPLVKVSEIPLILYAISSLLSAGVERFHVVVNTKGHMPISRVLNEFDINVDFVINREPERGNGYSLILGMKRVQDEFFLSMSDHIYDPRIPKVLLNAFNGSDFDILVGADSNPRYVDIDEATKIMTRGTRVVRIGKDLSRYAHVVDIGLFIMRRDLYRTYLDYASQNYVVELSSLIQYSVNQGRKVMIADVRGLPWIDIDTADDVYKARTTARSLIERAASIVREYIGIPQVYQPQEQ